MPPTSPSASTDSEPPSFGSSPHAATSSTSPTGSSGKKRPSDSDLCPPINRPSFSESPQRSKTRKVFDNIISPLLSFLSHHDRHQLGASSTWLLPYLTYNLTSLRIFASTQSSNNRRSRNSLSALMMRQEQSLRGLEIINMIPSFPPLASSLPVSSSPPSSPSSSTTSTITTSAAARSSMSPSTSSSSINTHEASCPAYLLPVIFKSLLARSQLIRLTSLTLDGPLICTNTEARKVITAIQAGALSHLEVLVVQNHSMMEDCMRQLLASLTDCPSLQTLGLGDALVSHRQHYYSVPRLLNEAVALPTFPRLKALKVSDRWSPDYFWIRAQLPPPLTEGLMELTLINNKDGWYFSTSFLSRKAFSSLEKLVLGPSRECRFHADVLTLVARIDNLLPQLVHLEVRGGSPAYEVEALQSFLFSRAGSRLHTLVLQDDGPPLRCQTVVGVLTHNHTSTSCSSAPLLLSSLKHLTFLSGLLSGIAMNLGGLGEALSEGALPGLRMLCVPDGVGAQDMEVLKQAVVDRREGSSEVVVLGAS